MSDFMEEFRQSVGKQVQGKLGSEMNLTEDQAATAIDAVGPLVLGGLKRQMDEHGGEDRLRHILDKYGDASVVDDPEAHIAKAANAEDVGDPALGGLLGDSGHQAAGLLDDKLGLAKGVGAKLIPMLAPLILGMLAKKRAAAPSSADGGGGGGLGMLTGILDRDGDGKILDDIGGMLFKQGGSAMAGQAKSGCLGMFMGKK